MEIFLCVLMIATMHRHLQAHSQQQAACDDPDMVTPVLGLKGVLLR
jgi:hypothetical protein